jgi:hypothetical protein
VGRSRINANSEAAKKASRSSRAAGARNRIGFR